MLTSESSSLLWLLGALIAMSTAYAALGWVRHAQYLSGGRRWGGLVAAAALLGTGVSVATILGLAGEAFAFPLGFRRLWAIGLWAGAVLVSLPILLWPCLRPGMLASIGTAVLLAALGAALQVSWVMSVGFRPGVAWRHEFTALGMLAMTVGFAIALNLTFPGRGHRQRREGWKLVAAGLMGLAWLAGEALVLSGANLQIQVGSIYRHELSASLTALIGAGLLPIVLAFVLVDLELRRRHRRHARRRQWRGVRPSTATPATSPAAAEAHPPLAQG